MAEIPEAAVAAPTPRVRGFWVIPSAAARRVGRGYFALQAVAGAAWWVAVFTAPGVREATLGRIDPVLMGLFDVPLFVLGSAFAATGDARPVARRAACAVAVWTLLVTAGLGVYATITGEAGWGALIMTAASVGTTAAWLLVSYGRIPAEALLAGPLGFDTAGSASLGRQLARTLLQLSGFWVLFLAALPALIVFVEHRWALHLPLPAWSRALGSALLLLASALGVWAAFAMSLRGDGTPLPSASANRLVVAGPYRWVRNPMALAGIAQAAGVGLVGESWLVVVYALCGALYWNALVRPFEEADLEVRFGAAFVSYRQCVRCWAPRLRPVPAPPIAE
ncbi:methyltransferase family protein [Leucobacter ruminantium]|uniref:Isoprenylcysteine carboxylmethyltransferase family protein n=1 Tax=Leucobacter ruminantium TaxID=1289170 RepID=A0A939LVR3_9MICO|nr:isoprenylcysteine carboxylmethyltransferase family protein [Leucobacter ruminantium]MBO1804063.1 isoprenylcysteine carboxylmethyltransferase family protein [Leucobacter ruminantium]